MYWGFAPRIVLPSMEIISPVATIKEETQFLKHSSNLSGQMELITRLKVS